MPRLDDFYISFEGTRLPYLQIAKFKRNYNIIHPWMDFGTISWRPENYPYEDTLIYHNRFFISINKDELSIINKILALSEKYYYLQKDETLYYDTGYWNIKHNGHSYIGIGYNRFQNIIKQLNTKHYAICFTDPYFILNISKNIEINSQILVDIYAYNEVYPFIEIIEPFQKACLDLDGILDKEELLLEHHIRNIWSSSKPIAMNPVGFIMENNFRMLPIIKNYFKNTKYKEINKLLYLCGTRRGGFIDEEFSNKFSFFILIDIWDLEFIKLFDIKFESI